MKTYYYYAASSPEVERYDDAQVNALELCDSQITEEFLRVVFQQCASGTPPFDLHIPSQIIHLGKMGKLSRYFIHCPVPNKPENDWSPLDRATAFFDNCTVYIYARRCLQVDPVSNLDE